MAEKPNGRAGTVKEQIIKDPVLDITFQFSVDKKGRTKLTLLGDFPYGNREHIFQGTPGTQERFLDQFFGVASITAEPKGVAIKVRR